MTTSEFKCTGGAWLTQLVRVEVGSPGQISNSKADFCLDSIKQGNPDHNLYVAHTCPLRIVLFAYACSDAVPWPRLRQTRPARHPCLHACSTQQLEARQVPAQPSARGKTWPRALAFLEQPVFSLHHVAGVVATQAVRLHFQMPACRQQDA